MNYFDNYNYHKTDPIIMAKPWMFRMHSRAHVKSFGKKMMKLLKKKFFVSLFNHFVPHTLIQGIKGRFSVS